MLSHPMHSTGCSDILVKPPPPWRRPWRRPIPGDGQELTGDAWCRGWACGIDRLFARPARCGRSHPPLAAPARVSCIGARCTWGGRAVGREEQQQQQPVRRPVGAIPPDSRRLRLREGRWASRACLSAVRIILCYFSSFEIYFLRYDNLRQRP
jgi:hypothetical protein